MKFEGICIAVKDIEKSKKFYAELFKRKITCDYGINVTFNGGFSIQQDFDWLLGISKDSIIEKSHNMEFYFEEEHFDDFLEKLKTYPDIKFVHDVKMHDWKQRVIRIYDPDYHIIEIGETFKSVVYRLFSKLSPEIPTSKSADKAIGLFANFLAIISQSKTLENGTLCESCFKT